MVGQVMSGTHDVPGRAPVHAAEHASAGGERRGKRMRWDTVRLVYWAVGLLAFFMLLTALFPATAAGQSTDIPAWLDTHVGEDEGQIAPPILLRARSLYMQWVGEGLVSNPCYFAMDATRPSTSDDGHPGPRFYVICEATQSFKAISSGHGSGRNLQGIVDFSNERRCARNFSNALDSTLTAGGAYLTSEIKTSFKGYYRASTRKYSPLLRSFIQFDGVGETANARVREIGGHAAVLLKATCRRKDPSSPYADREGYVPVGTVVDYTGGRSNGCTTWSASDAGAIIAMVENNPTTLYIYPEAKDIDAVAEATAEGRSLSRSGLYWNAACLREIGTPKFWPKELLEPVIAQYKADNPPSPGRPLPICK
jgi:hypothetical protein